MTIYDCTDDVLQHKARVSKWLGRIIAQLTLRSEVHDDSKLKEPEKALFDEWTPYLDRVDFGSDDYEAALEAMYAGLAHHYAANRHHPEHFAEGVDGMKLADMVEMFCDWLAAAGRKGVAMDAMDWDYLQQRFGLAPQLVNILRNTLTDMAMEP